MRNGFRHQATGLPGTVKTLYGYVSGTSSALFAFAGGGMYNVTSPVANPTAALSGLTSDVWHGVSYATSGGHYSTLVNGQDDPIVIGGPTTFNRLVAGNGTDPYTISGVNPATFAAITSHQRRLWFAQKDTSVAWYLPTDSLYGVAKSFDFGPIFKRGGYLLGLATWTVDSGEGSNDHLVGISSEGEVAVYGGLDVDGANTWQLQGLYYVGKPAPGRRVGARLGGDVYLISTNGVVSLNELVTSSQVTATPQTVYSRKIQLLISSLIANPASLEGWQVGFSPTNNLLFVNVPNADSGSSIQVAANTITSAWSVLIGMNAYCWTEFGGQSYFGTYDGRVFHAFTGYQDFQGVAGVIDSEAQPVEWLARQAFNYFGAPALQKQVGLYRLNFLVGKPTTIESRLSYDFYPEQVTYPPLALDYDDALWDEGIWDESQWGGGLATQRDWISGEGMGVAVSLTVAGSSNDEIVWASTDYTYQVGGPL